MASAGLWMMLVLAVLTVTTGLPVWSLLIGVASAFAALGLATGSFGGAVLSALGPRVLNLLEHDLLQAMPLYVFVGVLLQRLPLADALFSTGTRLFRRTGAGTSLAALAVGALVAPMNGSVASSSSLLTRLVAPRLGGMVPAQAITLVSAAATIGVVVPPSLVLILLGDAMMRAHTEASNLPGYAMGAQRIVNTQDVLHAALLPALCVLALWALLAWWRGRAVTSAPPTPRVRGQAWLAAVTALVIVVLLGGVFTGRLFAVEAAAAGGCMLAVATLVCRALTAQQWHQVLADTLALSGALFALLVGATTFSLVLQLFGTHRWLADLILASPWPPQATAACVLLAVAGCAWVLDAFEMVFVVIPIVAPLLVLQLHDAQQVAVLLLLVLQLSFMLPPLGYAVLMARAQSALPALSTHVLLRALAPFLAVQLLVIAVVFGWPAAVHLFDQPDPAAATAPPSEQDIVRQMEEMARQPAPEPAQRP